MEESLEPLIRKFSAKEQALQANQQPIKNDSDPLSPYFRRLIKLINLFKPGFANTKRDFTDSDFTMNCEWGYLEDNGAIVIELSEENFPVYCYTPLGQVGLLVSGQLNVEQLESIIKRASLQSIPKSGGEGGRLFQFLDPSQASAPAKFISRDQVAYSGLRTRWLKIRQDLKS